MPIDQLAGTDTEAKPDDLRASIAAQFDAWDGGNEPSEPSPSVSETEPVKSSVAEKADGDTGSDDRPRNPDGTFKPKSEAAPEKAAPVTETPATDKAAVTEAQAQPVADAPPAGWPADAKAEWSKLSPVLKAAVLKRETEISEGGRQWSEQRRNYERILSPLAQEASRVGLPFEEALNRLLGAHLSLIRDPHNTFRQLAQQYGVDLATLAGQTPAEVSRETVQPQQPQVSQEYIDRLASEAVQRRISEHETQMNLHAVNKFVASPGHERFNELEAYIIGVLPAVKSQNPGWSNEQFLQEAYNQALRAHPQTWAEMSAETERKAEEARRAQMRAHANGARRAASSVTGNAPGPQATGSVGTVRDDISAAYEQLAGGA